MTDEQLKEIEKRIFERVPQSKAEIKGTWCSSEKQMITRLRNSIKKKLINELKEKSEYPK